MKSFELKEELMFIFDTISCYTDPGSTGILNTTFLATNKDEKEENKSLYYELTVRKMVAKEEPEDAICYRRGFILRDCPLVTLTAEPCVMANHIFNNNIKGGVKACSYYKEIEYMEITK